MNRRQQNSVKLNEIILFMSEPQHLQYMIYFVCIPLSFSSLISHNRVLGYKLCPPPKKVEMNVGELSENVVWKCCVSLQITQSFFLKAVMQVHADWVIWAFLRAFCPQNKNIIVFDVRRTQHIILGFLWYSRVTFCSTHFVVRLHFLRHLE